MGYNLNSGYLTIAELNVRLDLLNDWLHDRDQTEDLLLIGGAALLINSINEGLDPRVTRDIDISYEMSHKNMTELNKFHKKLAELDIEVYPDLIPDYDEIRMTKHYIEYVNLSHLRVYTLDKLALLCIKSLTNRQKDLDDVIESGLLDTLSIEELMELDEMIKEYKSFLINPNSFNLHYNEVLGIIREKVGDNHDG